MIEWRRGSRPARRIAIAVGLVVAANALLLTHSLRMQANDVDRAMQESMTQLADLLHDVADPGAADAVPALVRGWVRTETGVVQVAVHDARGRLVADVSRPAGPGRQLHHQAVVRLTSGAELSVDATMDATAAVAARRQLIAEHTAEGLLGCVGVWALLAFAAARNAAVRRYRTLLATSRLLLSGASEDELLRRLCEVAVDEGGFVLAWIGLVRADGSVEPAASAGPARDYLHRLRLSTDPESPYGRGIGGRAMRERITVCCNDFERDPVAAPWREQARAHRIRASIGVPLQHAGEMIGLLSLYSDEAGAFTPLEIALVEQMAADISLGIDYLRRGARLADTIERLARIETQVHAGSFRFRLPERVLWCSGGAARLLGHPTGNSILPAATDAAADEDPAVALYDLATTTAPGDLEFDVPLTGSDGPTRWLRVTGAIESAPDGATEMRGLVQDVSERKSLEVAITQAADAERHRLASELHDNLGQLLTGTSLLVTALESRVRAADASLDPDMRQVSGLLHEALSVCRTLAHGSMRDLVHGLGIALEDLARQSSATGVICEAFIAPQVRALHGEQALELYRIAQEAVTNALKHAGCTRISIALRARGRLLDLVITDDGVGLPADGESGEGLGHRTMRYRAARAGGTIQFTAAPGGGLVVRVRVRLPAVVAPARARA